MRRSGQRLPGGSRRLHRRAGSGRRPRRRASQPRAIDALKLGLTLRAPGYNIFVAGEVGTGRSTTVHNQLAAVRSGEPPNDLCYVHNFGDPDEPRLLSFPAGRGRAFRAAMGSFVERLRKGLPDLFDSDDYRKRRTAAAVLRLR